MTIIRVLALTLALGFTYPGVTQTSNSNTNWGKDWIDTFERGTRLRLEQERLELEKKKVEIETSRQARTTTPITSPEDIDAAISAVRSRFPDFDAQEPRIVVLMDQFRMAGPPSQSALKNYLEGLYLIAKFASFTSGAAGAGDSEVFTNKDVVAMIGAGIGEQTVIAKIKTSHTKFALSTPELIRLKKSHVSDSIIEAMLRTQNTSQD